MKVSVLAFDLSDNATGRADLLARLLAPHVAVEVVGPRLSVGVLQSAQGGPVSGAGRGSSSAPLSSNQRAPRQSG